MMVPQEELMLPRKKNAEDGSRAPASLLVIGTMVMEEDSLASGISSKMKVA